MRILLLSNLFPSPAAPAGGGFVLRRIDALRSFGYAVDPWAIRPRRTGLLKVGREVLRGPSSSPERDETFRHVDVPMGGLEYMRAWRGSMPSGAVERAARTLAGKVDPDSVDVIVAHGLYMVPAGSIAGRLGQIWSKPYVVVAHGGDVNLLMPRRANHYAGTLNGASACIFVSRALLDTAWRHGMDSSRSYVVPNGVDTVLFTPARSGEGRVALGIDPSAPLVAYVGNLLYVKGADRLPDIFTEIRRREPRVQFVVAGSGPLGNKLTRSLKPLGVRMLGTIVSQQVAAVMAASDVLILPSRSEGWPSVIFEAFAVGTPVVGTAVGGIPEALADTGTVVANGPDLHVRFAAAVIRTLTDPPSGPSLRTAAREHEWAAVVRREAAILEDALGGVL